MKKRLIPRTLDIEATVACEAVKMLLDVPSATAVRFCPEICCEGNCLAYNMTCFGRVFHVGVLTCNQFGRVVEEGAGCSKSFSYACWDGKVEITLLG